MKSRYVELGLDAIQPRQRFVLRVQVNRRESVGAKGFVRRLAFLVGLGYVAGFFQGQYQQRPVFRVIRLALRGFAEIPRRCSRIVGL